MMTIKRTALATTLALFSAGAAHAELFGLPNGRSANPGNLPPLSVEAGFSTGGDYQNIAARVNYQLSPQLTLFGDFGLAEIGAGGTALNYDGNSFGAGVFFHLADQQFLPEYDVAGKVSYHLANLEFAGTDLDYDNISLEALVSSENPLTAGGLMWYGNVGVNILNVDGGFGGSESDTELLLGGGVYLPAGPGQVYGGVDLIDDIRFGIGYRYFVQ